MGAKLFASNKPEKGEGGRGITAPGLELSDCISIAVDMGVGL